VEKNGFQPKELFVVMGGEIKLAMKGNLKATKTPVE
jgi:hypothetical protein